MVDRWSDVPVRTRLARSFVSVTVGLPVVVMLVAAAAVLIATSPLWLLIAPAAVEKSSEPTELESE
jgi:hypothetical protein